MDQSSPHTIEEEVEITVRLKPATLLIVDRLREELGLRSRSDLISRLLDELLQRRGT